MPNWDGKGIRECNPNELTLEGIQELQALATEARVLLSDAVMLLNMTGDAPASVPESIKTPQDLRSLWNVWRGKVSAFLERSY